MYIFMVKFSIMTLSKKPHIHIVGHGGTIGMEDVVYPDGTKVRMPAKNAQDLLKRTSKDIQEMANFTFSEFEKEDSTNLNPYHWSKLAHEIDRIQKDEEIDAVVVTHGTDTMTYHAGAISLAMGKHLKIPVVFTGSQKPMGQEGSDATPNLEEAIMTTRGARELGLNRTLLVFDHRVFLGSRAVKISESRFDAFDSPAFPTLGEFVGSGIVWSPVAENIAYEDKKTIHQKLDNGLKAKFDFNVVSIELTPGLNPIFPKAILETGKCKGLILKSFGGGNVPDKNYKEAGQETNLIPMIKEATNKYKVPVLVTTQFIGGKTKMDQYGPGKAALDAGALATGDMTHVMSPVKLMWLVGQTEYQTLEEVRRGMLTNFVDEISTV
ncbi:hypothetical protein A3G67_04190 [Candidatus Roizmanbacteria bacterium RIFCSPLOWO2_12_FULL_40_12]|uniref:L-asparaginase N-terminal domain-containing protein n=1 Tax=Candidatus Roizmanbacteria bacterium RIFCSPLOWO2_01_FULL_40_42 TaxID=1802066 RepID=A0A1F7J6N0_9BACT|nr:MAG: hypothetical protein A2779_00700 [Candidatus Roizmanbacteria bacterium RIFCSPHIGHO2_01_FULL_40_98]OGK29165.1 MAG: hypothetical protein A3C31_02675 [Candidatus Roizmanbacteria bacterium RIFCSPHIGHO2_02_FULL_40_53]OGK30708.1 MAG: hypothetical protein A2W49_01755 [Candidatus Roizmanbacteria bacterium RIFCSPHIGHO2_12_41_18]OGK37201.1 MAG: hypothetical protein A3E69_01885 [Candidatus Roizmanbacteria bacterium RIFCSPHIGHO2_12_FULL_40_130]OGK51275.1 MAG: hypothetical protein A3B50_04760 [Candi